MVDTEQKFGSGGGSVTDKAEAKRRVDEAIAKTIVALRQFARKQAGRPIEEHVDEHLDALLDAASTLDDALADMVGGPWRRLHPVLTGLPAPGEPTTGWDEHCAVVRAEHAGTPAIELLDEMDAFRARLGELAGEGGAE